jgi:putative tryptophan/tyrosine transport system substrate-binding protein
MPVIGFLGLGSPNPSSPFAVAFREGLAEAGYVPGQNVATEFRWANAQASLLPQLAAELVDRKVAVIVTIGSRYAALAAKAATSTIPVAFATTDDPVQYGLVTSLSRPGGNVTGVTYLNAELASKRLNLLLELTQATTIAYLSGPSNNLIFEERKNDMLAAGRALGRKIIVLEVRQLDFEAAFATLVAQRAGALIVGDFISFFSPGNRDKILELAARHKIPAMYPTRQFADNGGLISYDSDLVAVVRQLGGHYVGQILKGAKPADLPVQRPSKFELVINLRAAKAQGLTIPRGLLAAASELIE